MELDEMKAVWSSLSDQVEEKHQLTRQQILDMMEQKYRRQANGIIFPEVLGSIICFAFSGYILFNIQKLDDLLSLSFGLLSALMMIALPIFSLRKMGRWVEQINISENTYQQTLTDFARVKRHFAKLQRYGYVLGVATMVLIIPPMAKIMKGKDAFADDSIWYRLPFGIIFILFFVYFTTRFYKSRLDNIDEALQDRG